MEGEFTPELAGLTDNSTGNISDPDKSCIVDFG